MAVLAQRQQTTKKASARAASSAKKTSGGTRKKAAQKKPLVRRELWAFVLLLLSFVAFLSFFNVRGFAIDWYRWLTGTLIGYGFYLMPFALLAAGVLLLVKRKGKARLRVTCIMLLPVLMGAMRHLLFDVQDFTFSFASFGAMAANGRELVGGGLLAGSLGLLLRAAFSNIGALILCVLLFVVALIVACNVSPRAVWQRLKPLPEPEEETPPARAPRRVQGRAPSPSGGRRVDVSLEEAEMQSPRRSRRNRDEEPRSADLIAPPGVPTPAEVLAAQEYAEAVETSVPQAANDERAAEPAEPWMPPSARPVTPDFSIHQAEVAPPVAEAEPLAEAEVPAAAELVAESASELPDMQPEQPAEEQEHTAHEEPVLAGSYLYPPISLLHESRGQNTDHTDEIRRCAERLTDTLQSFGVETTIVGVTRGPTVTRYELQPQRGVKFSRISGLSDDIALALGAASVRISTIPDKLAIGIEVPNETQQTVTLREILDSPEFKASKSRLSFAVGRDIENKCIVGDIAKMPHMLIAGTTGSGKSVCINSILISLIYKSTPDEVRLIMVDPKMIELGVYNGIPHLLIPVVTDPKKAAGALGWAVSEMMKRYKLMSELGARDLASYNAEIRRRGEGEVLPQIVIVIDELADLMFVAANEVEEAIARIAQMARAAGMHLIIATQRPSADVITGIMKANIPSRIAFTVASQIESRIILDATGAEKLIGRGDMLYNPLGMSKPLRVQGCFITTGEVEEVISFIKNNSTADYSEEVMEHIERQAESSGGGGAAGDAGEEEDSMLQAAIEVVVDSGQASVSMLQRRLKLGYSRAARLVDQMEERGVVGPFEGSKPRQVLITRDQWKEMVLRRQGKDV